MNAIQRWRKAIANKEEIPLGNVALVHPIELVADLDGAEFEMPSLLTKESRVVGRDEILQFFVKFGAEAMRRADPSLRAPGGYRGWQQLSPNLDFQASLRVIEEQATALLRHGGGRPVSRERLSELKARSNENRKLI